VQLFQNYFVSRPGEQVAHGLFLKSSSILSLCFGFNKLLGFTEKVIIANVFGTSPESDAFFMAQNILVTGWLFVEEIFVPALIPVVQSYRNQSSCESQVQSFVSLLLLASLPLILIFSVVPLAFPETVSKLLFPGFSTQTKTMVIDLWCLFSLGCVPYLLTPILNAYANSRKMFLLPAIAQLIGRLFMLACLILFSQDQGISSGGWGVLAYGITHFVLLVVLIRFPIWKGIKYSTLLSPQIGRFSKLALPLTLGLIFSQATIWLDIHLASNLSPGAISALSYSRKLVDLPIILGAFCIGTVMLPYLAHMVSKKDFASFRIYFSRYLRLCIFFYCFLGIGYYLFSGDIVTLFFSGGRFDSESVEMVCGLVRLFALGLPVFALEIFVMQASFAVLHHWYTVLCGMFFASLNIAVTLWLFPKFGLAIIPFALITQKFLKSTVLWILLARRLRKWERASHPNTRAI
jgi:putative peptidoglycan lipid II flippase